MTTLKLTRCMMSTKQLLDFVATPKKEGKGFSYMAVDAELQLNFGCHSTHYLCFEKETKTLKRRWFWHQAHDAEEIISEKKFMEMYGKAGWYVLVEGA
jgi:hypothetical protein